MVDSSIHFKVVPTKFIPLLSMIHLWDDIKKSGKFTIFSYLKIDAEGGQRPNYGKNQT